MHTNPHQERAERILFDNGWQGMSEQDAFQILRPRMQSGDLMAVSIEDAIDESNLHRWMNQAVMQMMGERA